MPSSQPWYFTRVDGDLLEAKTKFIAQQCNCITRRSAHLAAALFARFPYANVYSCRPMGFVDKPGTIIIRGDGQQERFVINMLGQYGPGKSKNPDSPRDGTKARLNYFVSCLKEIQNIQDLDSVAFPHGIGCGAAGGSWERYELILNRFAYLVRDKAKVFIYKLPRPE